MERLAASLSFLVTKKNAGNTLTLSTRRRRSLLLFNHLMDMASWRSAVLMTVSINAIFTLFQAQTAITRQAKRQPA
ncbi:hypothetical protein BKM30_22220 [Pseudomonas syringae pv. syringae]|nr:hypothetical protein BKM27_22395 [Pseudomonas syringae pv. syringae]POR75374.1 hypothetical protein BKM30_22220 [Pseudomonas syringae pv. syringae]